MSSEPGVLHEHRRAARAAPLERDEPVPGAHVRKEVAHPVLAHRAAPGWIVVHHERIGVELVGGGQLLHRLERRVEEDACVLRGGHRDGHIVVVQQPRGLAAGHAGILHPVVAGDAKHRMVGPLERVLLTAVLPDGGDAAPAEDVDDVFQRHLERRNGAACRHLGDASLGDALLAGKLQERRVVAALLPVAQLDRASVLYVVVAVDGDTLRFHPLVVELRPADVGLLLCLCGRGCHR